MSCSVKKTCQFACFKGRKTFLTGIPIPNSLDGLLSLEQKRSVCRLESLPSNIKNFCENTFSAFYGL